MTRGPGAAEDRGPPTSDRLRTEIDTGRTGDKIGFPDPAAAPLGTDDEAAGTPPGPEQLRPASEAKAERTAESRSASLQGAPSRSRRRQGLMAHSCFSPPGASCSCCSSAGR